VFIACSYSLAAQIYARQGLPDLALALYSVRVPSASWIDLEVWKAEQSAHIACLVTAVSQVDAGCADPDLADMLTHDWPLPDEIDPLILTNRALNNNVFEYRTRTDIPRP